MVRLRSGARTRESDPAARERIEVTPATQKLDTTKRVKQKGNNDEGENGVFESPALKASPVREKPMKSGKKPKAAQETELEPENLQKGSQKSSKKSSHKPELSTEDVEEEDQTPQSREVKRSKKEHAQHLNGHSATTNEPASSKKRGSSRMLNGPEDHNEGVLNDSAKPPADSNGNSDQNVQTVLAREILVHRCSFADFKPESIETIAGFGRFLAVGRASGEVDLWERGDSTLFQKFAAPGTRSQGLRSLVWHDHRLFGANLDGSIFEVDFRNRCQVVGAAEGGGGIWGMDSNGEHLATASEDGKVRIYSAKPLGMGVDLERVLSGAANGRLLCIKFHGTDPKSYLFTGGMDGMIRKWSLSSRRVVEQIPVPSFSRSIKIWSLDTHGEAIACGDSLGRVHVWAHTEIGTPQTFSEHRADVLTVKFSADGQSLFASGVDSRVASFRVAHGSWVYTYSHRAHTHDVRAQGIFNLDGDEILCTGGVDTHLVWYPVRSFERVRPRKESPFRQRQCVFPSEASGVNRVLLVMHTYRLELWHLNIDLKQHSHLASIMFEDDVTLRCAALSNSHRFIACSDDARGLTVFSVDLSDSSKQAEDDDEAAEVTITKVHIAGLEKLVPLSVAFGASDNILIVSTSDQMVVIDLNALIITKRFPLPAPLVALCTSLDGQWVAGVVASPVQGPPEGIELFNLDAMRHHASLPGTLFGEAPHAAFTFDPSSTELIVARLDGSVFGFAVEEQKLLDWNLRVSSQYPERIIGIAFNPANKDEIIPWSWSSIVVLDRVHPERPPRVLRKFKPLIHACFWRSDDLFVLEAPFVNTLKHLPDVLERERFGT